MEKGGLVRAQEEDLEEQQSHNELGFWGVLVFWFFLTHKWEFQSVSKEDF